MSTNLLAPVTLHKNVFDIESIKGIPSAYTWEKWRYFVGYSDIHLKNQKDLFLNTDEGYRAIITDKLIKEFNTDTSKSAWAEFGTSYPYRGYNNPLTREDIFAIQRFTFKADTNVIIDGWLGTQTLQMNYPPITYSEIFNFRDIKAFKAEFDTYDPEKIWGVIWGDKRFVIKVKDIINIYTVNSKAAPSYLTLYDPAKHKNEDFEKNSNKTSTWLKFEQVNSSLTPEKTNSETEKTQNNKKNLQNQTKLNKTF